MTFDTRNPNLWSLRTKAAVVALLAGCTCTADAQNFPSKPIRFVTSEVGSGSDFIARLVGPGLAQNVGQQVVVENRPSGVIPGETVAKAPPDGYTLLVYGGAFWLQPLLIAKLPYDVITDFTPITLLAISPNILVVNSSMPVKSVKELIALAKANPGKLNYSAPGAASSTALSAELFKSLAGLNIVGINYRGTGQAVTDLVGGQVHMSFPNPASAAPHIKSGRLRALAVTSAQPSALFPDLPTMAASGVPGYESGSSFGMFGPAKLPAALTNQLNQEMTKVLANADMKQRFLSVGMESMSSTAEAFGAKVKSELTRMGKILRDAGIKPN